MRGVNNGLKVLFVEPVINKSVGRNYHVSTGPQGETTQSLAVFH